MLGFEPYFYKYISKAGSANVPNNMVTNFKVKSVTQGKNYAAHMKHFIANQTSK
jgi:hypothetical protein